MKCTNNTWKSYQTAGGPPSKLWSLPKITQRAQQKEFTIKTQKHNFIQFWQLKNAKTEENTFISILYFVHYSLAIV